MLPQFALSALVWSPKAACVVAATAWQLLAVSLDAPRVATDAPFVVVDGKLTATSGACDVLRAPACSARTSVVVVALERCTYFDVHIADARVPATATVQIEMLVRGAIRPVRWRVVVPVGPLARKQAVVASESMACERAYRLYVPDLASCHRRDRHESVAVYRIVMCGVGGSITRIRHGRAFFPNGPFAAEIRDAPTCVRLLPADIFLFDDVEGTLRCFVPCYAHHEMHVLRVPVAATLVVVQFRAPMDFSRQELPARCTAQLLMLDGSVVTVTDRTPTPLSVPLIGVVEARFNVSEIVCTNALVPVTGERPRALRVVSDYDGQPVLLACAPIVVA
jgi:hypothetical protein